MQTELLFQQKLLRFINARRVEMSLWLCSGLCTRNGTAALEWHREMWGLLPSASCLSDSTTSLSLRMWPIGLSSCVWVQQKNTNIALMWGALFTFWQLLKPWLYLFLYFFSVCGFCECFLCVSVCFQNDVIIFAFLSRVVGVQTVVFWKKKIL